MRYFIYSVLIILIGCQSPSDKIVKDFKKVDSSLDTANQSIENANRQLSDALITDSGFIKIKNAGTALVTYIESVKEKIKQVSGKVDTDEGMTNLTASNKVMFEQKKADTIFAALKNFQNLALLKCEQDSVKDKVNIKFRYLGDNEKQINTFFKNVPAVAALTMLSKFQNDVKSTENVILLNSIIKKK